MEYISKKVAAYGQFVLVFNINPCKNDKTKHKAERNIFSHVVYWASHGKAFREGNGSIFSQKSKHALNLARLSPPPVQTNNSAVYWK